VLLPAGVRLIRPGRLKCEGSRGQSRHECGARSYDSSVVVACCRGALALARDNTERSVLASLGCLPTEASRCGPHATGPFYAWVFLGFCFSEPLPVTLSA
jgi:hypothetical protein